LNVTNAVGFENQIVINASYSNGIARDYYIAACRASIVYFCKIFGYNLDGVVQSSFSVKSKKYESKYYTNAIVEKISVVAKKSQQLEVDMETGEIL
jgi:hypothetical protein